MSLHHKIRLLSTPERLSGPDWAAARCSHPYRRRSLSVAIAGALALGLHGGVQAQLFPAEIELGDLDGSNGFVINGVFASDYSGRSVAAAGDINGDGIDDLILGADGANSTAGRSYVVYGSRGGFASPFNLSSINGLNGFVINGAAAGDYSGRSVSAAGDINGDGVDDLIIGAPYADPNGNYSGSSFVVFGSAGGPSNPVNLISLNGLNGFVLNGETGDDRSGFSVSSAGDFNGDGLDDLVIGAWFADANGNAKAGKSYVVFGSSATFGNPFNLSNLNGLNGLVLNGEVESDQSGGAVSGAGDFNGDGYDDLIIGAPYADPNGAFSGRSYLVFGSSSAIGNPFNLSALNGLNGIALNGEASSDASGRSVSTAGDVNADGTDDIFIGAQTADPGGTGNAGRSYVVFGSQSSLGNPLNLAGINGSNGFVIDGEGGSLSGVSISGGGDINGDGIDDLLIGALQASPSSSQVKAGRSYVIFGSAAGFPNPFSLSSLDGSNGFIINGETALDESGNSVSIAGDINGDGVDDLIIGARRADPNGNNDAGRSYVVFGRSDALFADRFVSD